MNKGLYVPFIIQLDILGILKLKLGGDTIVICCKQRRDMWFS